MKIFTSCQEAVEICQEEKRFTVAHLCTEEKTMQMHIHECYEVYYSIAGGRQFLIDDRCYEILPGDLFLINNYESHYLSQVDSTAHERIILSIAPEYLQIQSTENTDLARCFHRRGPELTHKISLNPEQQKRFIYLIHKITSASGYGADLTENAAFLELMIFINRLFQEKNERRTSGPRSQTQYHYHEAVAGIITYINSHITERITLPILAQKFYLSEAHICRLFKAETGTTVNKYITARRISIAKARLAEGLPVGEACVQSGFCDYTNFVRVFTRTVGLTPKRYGKNSRL